MKKWGCTLLALAFSTSVAAEAESMKIALVKRMYGEVKKTDNSLFVIEQHADAVLKNAFKMMQLQEESCLQADYMFDSQDPDYSVPIQFYPDKEDVIADLGYSQVRFKFTYIGGRYKIADVGELKNALLCKE